jgi:hypothetical protein
MTVQMTDIVTGLFAIAGAPLSEESPAGHFAWDGQTFRLGGVDAGGRLHDLAHWLIATEEERAQPEFGLGTSPWDGTLEALDTAPWNDRDSWNMEHRASLLGILFMKRLGLDWAQVAKSHGWDDLMWGGEDRRRRDLKWLRDRNLLTSNGRPALLQGVRVR